jgi:hypothetical protein
VGLATRYYFLSVCCCLICGLVSVGCPLRREDGSAICSVITQWFELRRTRKHTLLSHQRLPQPEGPGSRIYIPQAQGGPVIPPGIGFPLRRLLRLVGLRWRYSNPPPTWWARSPFIYPSGTGWSSPNSKSRYGRRSVNQYVLVPSQRGFRGAPSARITIRHQEEYIKAKFLMLPLGGLHAKHAVQRGIWAPTQHLLWDQGKTTENLARVGRSQDLLDAN